MHFHVVLNKTYAKIPWLVVGLSVTILLMEIVPEMEVKVMVVPILAIMTTLFILELKEHWHIKWKWFDAFKIVLIGFVGVSIVGEIFLQENAKIIVVPALALSILTCLIDVCPSKAKLSGLRSW
jgi:hypothetical protein